MLCLRVPHMLLIFFLGEVTMLVIIMQTAHPVKQGQSKIVKVDFSQLNRNFMQGSIISFDKAFHKLLRNVVEISQSGSIYREDPL